jgi:hypothetical protein
MITDQHSEHQRLAFVEGRDGLEGAISFARQTVKVYRKAVLCSRKRGYAKPHHGSLPDYRRGFIESYLVAKQFLKKHGRSVNE